MQADALPATPCVECRQMADHVNLADEVKPPAPGDKTLCLQCGSLNVLDDQLRFRAPTVDEFLDVARDAGAQRLRRAILTANRKLAGKGKRA